MTDKPETTTNTGTAPETSGQQTSGQQGNPVDPGWLADRLDRAKKTALNDFLREIGVDNPDSLKALVTAAKDAEAKSKTALEKAADDATKLQTRLATAEQQVTTAEAKVTALEQARINDRIDGIIKGKVTDKVKYPDDIVDWARSKSGLDLNKVLKTDGSVDEKFVTDLISAVQAARPDWFKGAGVGSPSNHGGKPPTPDANKALGDRPLFRL